MTAEIALPLDTKHAQAVISPCGRYRYWLRRVLAGNGGLPAVFCMLNPSTADASADDPTIRRCRRFALAWGYNELIVVNLFALRATDPRALFHEDAEPIGPDNHGHVLRACEQAGATDPATGKPRGIFVCAWGHHGAYMQMDQTVLGWVETTIARPHALKITKHGQPQHPLYLGADCKPFPWPTPWDGASEA